MTGGGLAGLHRPFTALPAWPQPILAQTEEKGETPSECCGAQAREGGQALLLGGTQGTNVS